MSDTPTLSEADVDRIADRVVAKLTLLPAAAKQECSTDWLSKNDAAAYLTVSRTSFDRLRGEYPKSLKPASEHPLRWTRAQLDVFKFNLSAGKAA